MAIMVPITDDYIIGDFPELLKKKDKCFSVEQLH